MAENADLHARALAEARKVAQEFPWMIEITSDGRNMGVYRNRETPEQIVAGQERNGHHGLKVVETKPESLVGWMLDEIRRGKR